MATERLQVILELVTGQYKREAASAASATGRIGDQAASTGTATSKLGGRFTALATTAKFALAGVATAAVVKFAGDSIEAAKNLGESINAVNQIFGDAAGRIHSFGQVSAQVVGLSTREFNELATNTGALLTNMGFEFDAAAGESVKLTRRAADMASVFNTDVGEALDAINAGLRGETEPLRRFGVSLSDARIRAKAVEMGLADTTAAVDEHGKTVAALELIYADTAKVQGDFLRTSDELANSERILAAEAENASARFGKAIVGPKTFFTNLMSDTLSGLQVLGLFGSTAQQATIEAMRMEEATANVIDTIRDGGDPFTALADSMLHIAESGTLTADKFLTLADLAGLTSDQFDDFRTVVLDQAAAMGLDAELTAELNDAMVGAGQAGSDAAPGIGEAGDAAADAASFTWDAADAYRDLISAWKESSDPVFAAVDSLGRLRDAQDKVNQMIADGETDTIEFREAQADLVEQTWETQANLNGLTLDQLNATIDGTAATLKIPREEAEKIYEELGLIDGLTVRPVVDINVRQSGITTVRLPSGALSRGLSRQHGGFVPALTPTLVGERRPEVIVPARDSYVYPSVDSFRGGGATTINVTAPESAGVMEQVRMALAFDRLGRT